MLLWMVQKDEKQMAYVNVFIFIFWSLCVCLKHLTAKSVLQFGCCRWLRVWEQRRALSGSRTAFDLCSRIAGFSLLWTMPLYHLNILATGEDVRSHCIVSDFSPISKLSCGSYSYRHFLILPWISQVFTLLPQELDLRSLLLFDVAYGVKRVKGVAN
jgi:hypothetical protein